MCIYTYLYIYLYLFTIVREFIGSIDTEGTGSIPI